MPDVGSLSGVFTGTVSFEWVPDPLIVASEIRRVGIELMDMRAPLEIASRIAAHDIDRHFQTKTDPDGAPWPEWSDSYALSGQGEELMERTGALRAAASSPSAFDVTVVPGGGEVVFTGAGLPGYGMIHHFGSPNRQTRWGTPNPLPQRAFAGISTEAQIEILNEFDAWVGAVAAGFNVGVSSRLHPTSVFTHPSGRQQFRIGGQWGPNV